MFVMFPRWHHDWWCALDYQDCFYTKKSFIHDTPIQIFFHFFHTQWQLQKVNANERCVRLCSMLVSAKVLITVSSSGLKAWVLWYSGNQELAASQSSRSLLCCLSFRDIEEVSKIGRLASYLLTHFISQARCRIPASLECYYKTAVCHSQTIILIYVHYKKFCLNCTKIQTQY